MYMKVQGNWSDIGTLLEVFLPERKDKDKLLQNRNLQYLFKTSSLQSGQRFIQYLPYANCSAVACECWGLRTDLERVSRWGRHTSLILK